jgi:hypothetical protein
MPIDQILNYLMSAGNGTVAMSGDTSRPSSSDVPINQILNHLLPARHVLLDITVPEHVLLDAFEIRLAAGVEWLKSGKPADHRIRYEGSASCPT